jgi:MoaA/NifB/PqqE/SkfB family radical SAM enzyme
MRLRRGGDGIHCFDRQSGMNVLLDEIHVPRREWSRAPRFVSIALTNLCDLQCPFCYAPKQPAQLDFEEVIAWSLELDMNGCLGIGFGGGEPTLFPQFSTLCQELVDSTELSISFTTHAHRFTPVLRDELCGAVHFIRVSMDGVNGTYERIRKRSFTQFVEQLKIVRETSAFGINYVVTDQTVRELDQAADLVFAAGAKELLLLPEYSPRGLKDSTRDALEQWVLSNSGRIQLSLSEAGVTEGMPIADPFVKEKGLRAYVHVNAFGNVSSTSYDQSNAISIDVSNGLLAAITTYGGED